LADVKNRNLITFHGAWYYFADAFGLTVAGTFEPAAADREPTPKYLTALAAAIKQSGVRVVYVEPQFAADAYRAFVEENSLRLVPLDDLGGTADRDSYEALMRYDVQAIADNQ
ncbi:MAG: metal ABC transporter substrate-binding protein, partial [Patescibacteria group bacterium]|nr:metal ABC transporter substrate-binding protein [Patescibacteria group bacterium]